MASARKSSTEIISDALGYKKIPNNQKDSAQDKQDAILEIETHLKTISVEFKSLLGKLSALLNDIKTKQEELTSAKTNENKLAIEELASELGQLENKKTKLAPRVQELKLQIVAAQEKILAVKTIKKPQSSMAHSLGVIETIIQKDQEKLRNKSKYPPRKSPDATNEDEDLPVDGTHPQAKDKKRCTIL